MEIFNIATLALSGLLLTFVGISRMTNPIKTYAKSSGITIDNNTDLLNEMRGVGALMMTGGIIILLGTIMSKITTISLATAGLIFIGFAIGRIFSLTQDGKPNKQIIQGLMSELILGTANVVGLVMVL